MNFKNYFDRMYSTEELEQITPKFRKYNRYDELSDEVQVNTNLDDFWHEVRYYDSETDESFTLDEWWNSGDPVKKGAAHLLFTQLKLILSEIIDETLQHEQIRSKD